MNEPRVLSVTEATRRGVAGLVKDAEHGGDLIVQRHGTPVAAVVSMPHFQQLTEAIEGLREASLVLSRAATDTGERTGLDAVFAEFGLDRAELQAELDVEQQDQSAARLAAAPSGASRRS